MKQNFSNSSFQEQPTKLVNNNNNNNVVTATETNNLKRISSGLIGDNINDTNNIINDHDPNTYSDEEAKQIVGLFAYRFPSFCDKLKEQFPQQWVTLFDDAKNGNKLHRSGSASRKSLSAIQQTAQLFQFSQLKRNERERLIHQVTQADQQ